MATTFKVGPAAQARAVERHHAARAVQSAALTARLVEAFIAEPDREYADEFYGAMLRERGVPTERLVVL